MQVPQHTHTLVTAIDQFVEHLENHARDGEAIKEAREAAQSTEAKKIAKERLDSWCELVRDFLAHSFKDERIANDFLACKTPAGLSWLTLDHQRSELIEESTVQTLDNRIRHLKTLKERSQYFNVEITPTNPDEETDTPNAHAPKDDERKSIIGFAKKQRLTLLFFIIAGALLGVYLVRTAKDAPSPIEWIENGNLNENIVSVHLAPALKRKNEGTASFLDSKKLVHFQSVQYTIKERQIHAKITWELWYSEKDENNPSPLTGYTDLISKVIPGDTKIELLYDDLPLESANLKIVTRRAAFKKSNKPYQDVGMADSWKSDEWKSVVEEEENRKTNSKGSHNLVKLWDWRGEYDAKNNSWLAQVTLQPLHYRTSVADTQGDDIEGDSNGGGNVPTPPQNNNGTLIIVAIITAVSVIIAALISRDKREPNSN